MKPYVVDTLSYKECLQRQKLQRAGFRFEWTQRVLYHGGDSPKPPELMVSAPFGGQRVTRLIAREADPHLALSIAWKWWWARIWYAHFFAPRLSAPEGVIFNTDLGEKLRDLQVAQAAHKCAPILEGS